MQRPFSKLDSLAQYMHTLVPPLGRAVQVLSVRVLFSLSISVPGVEARPGEFNFGMGTGGGRVNLVAIEV